LVRCAGYRTLRSTLSWSTAPPAANVSERRRHALERVRETVDGVPDVALQHFAGAAQAGCEVVIREGMRGVHRPSYAP
jgi:hypothetical protein